MRRWSCWVSLTLLLSLLGPGCRGGGGGAAAGITVTIAPKTGTVVLRQTLTLAASVSGGSVTVATIVSGNGAIRAANTVTITSTSAHNLSIGQSVTIGGVSDSSFNGTFTIAAVPSTTTFTYPQTGADATSGGGTVSTGAVKWFVNSVENGNTTVGTITPTASTSGFPTVHYTAPDSLPPATTLTIASNGAVRSSNVVTITTTAAHNLIVGQLVTITGVTDGSFNGTFFIQTVPSTTTFTFAQTGSNATSGGGTVTSTTVQVKAQAVADSTKSDTATVSVDSGISISVAPKTATVGTSETFQLTATVTGSTNTNVTWAVNGGSANGTISTNGLYTAPPSVPNPAAVTITATAAVDPNKTALATITVVTAADPTLAAVNPVNPTSGAQGSAFQDVYLTGTNFISTSTVRANGNPVPAIAVSSTLLRARIPDCLLSAAGTLALDVRRQNGTTTPTKNFTVTPVRPAVVGASPDSATQTLSSASVSFHVNGGYFGTSAPCTPPTSPAVTAEFDGNVRTTAVTSRQLNVTIGGPLTSDLNRPGLFSVAGRNTGAAQPVAVTNLAVQPSPAVTPPSVVLASLPVGTKPGAVAVNTATGFAVVANHDSNNITIIDLKTSPPTKPATVGGNPNPIPVGTGPTGVAVDNVRNLALVANNGSNNISVVNLATGTVTATLGSANNIGTAPFSVGISPLAGKAVVAYQSTNNATLIDLTVSPPVVNGTVSVSTGPNPQVAVEPRLNWAILTPGGGGSLSIVDLARRSSIAVAAAPTGASRASNVVTITTTIAHDLIPNEAVLITGVADASFNGTFTVAAVPSTTTFTFAQMGPTATSGGGTVTHALPVATATLGIGVRGVAINPETEKALLTDPTTTSLIFFSLLDQTVSTLPPPGAPLEAGMVAAAVNPLIDIGVTLNPGGGVGPGTASVIDPRTPARIATVAVGTGPKAVAIDPGSNLAVVANEGSNDVTIFSLGDIRPLHIVQLALTTDRQFSPSNPTSTLSSLTDLPLTIIGKGFGAGSRVRLDGACLAAPSGVTDRQLSVTVPAAMLAGPRRYAVDVVDSCAAPTARSNVTDLTVIQPVDVSSAGCAAPGPRGVAIDAERNLAVVTNTGSGCNNISLVNVVTGAVTKTIAVGTNPQGVAVISRLSKAVVANRGSNNASVVDLAGGTVTGTVTVGTEPIGVAINQDTAQVVVANSGSNTASLFSISADPPGAVNSVVVDQRPVAVAIDSIRNLALVANAGSSSNNLDQIDLSATTPTVGARYACPQNPTGVVFDPASNLFVAVCSSNNDLILVDPAALQSSALRVGINPTSLASNFQSSTLVTVNTASNTMTVVDFLDQRVRAILGMGGSQQFSIDIHPRTNLAVIADESKNRVLLVPLPR